MNAMGIRSNGWVLRNFFLFSSRYGDRKRDDGEYAIKLNAKKKEMDDICM